jgi:hypothetical protein
MTCGEYIEVRVKGRSVNVPSACIDGRTVIATGRWMKIASVMDEGLIEGETVSDPEMFTPRLKNSELKADIFTFAQKLPCIVPKHKYQLEWDNAAVVPITSFSEWFERRAEHDVRRAVRRAQKLGVVVTLSEFNDTFVEGISRIYNESPVRQGTAFWHYQKDFEAVKRENSTYLERSAFIGAYYKDELIGFIKMVYVGTIATTLQVISQKKHFDKKPTNALIAKAIEICEQKGVSHLVYGSYVGNDPKSSLTEFKRRNGFEKVLLPRYYIPLTPRGSIALTLRLHHPLAERIPKSLLAQLRKTRALWYDRKPESATKPS